MIRCLSTLLLILLLAGCDTRNQLARVWLFSGPANPPSQEVYDVVHRPDYPFADGSFLDLQADGTYTSYFSTFDHGRWQQEDGRLLLESDRHGLMELQVGEVQKGRLEGVYKGLPFWFQGHDNTFASPDDNPFGRANNTWREKAARKESAAEIAARLRNHFRHWEKYFAWGLDQEIKVLDVRSLPGPLKLYGNGFELLPHDDQPEAWKDCFFDADDSWKAYEKMYYLLYRENIDWPKTDNRFERFVSAFRQLQEKMK